MKNTVLLSIIALSALVVMPVFAETGLNVSANADTGRDVMFKANAGVRVNNNDTLVRVRAKAGEEINRRSTSLVNIMSRIEAMSQLSEADKATLKANIQAQIDALNALKARIDANGDLTSLKSDIKTSVDGSYRMFALTVPKAHITAALDRLGTLADTMTRVGTQLSVSINQAQTAGKNVSVMTTLLADYTTHVQAAKDDYTAARSLLATVSIDATTDTQFQTNKKILMDVRAKISSGSKHLKEAREDFHKIRNELKSVGIDTSVSVKGEVKS